MTRPPSLNVLSTHLTLAGDQPRALDHLRHSDARSLANEPEDAGLPGPLAWFWLRRRRYWLIYWLNSWLSTRPQLPEVGGESEGPFRFVLP